MNPIIKFFVSSKYQHAKDNIFHGFIFAVIATGLLYYFTGINIPGIIVAILFVTYEIPNLLFNCFDVWKSAKNKR